ncbi:MAG: phenylalanine--tRNA ligase subunit beta [Erysipelothrix sp.]|nr:phenylalanine--tRNA ligase subunit beta [Erysipelothrix sp.]
MNVSRKWLGHYVDIENLSNTQLADVLTGGGLEVEGFTPLIPTSGLIIGHVLACEKHPNADTLFVTKVDVGHEVLDIVCGGQNVAVNQKVIVAPIGVQVGDLLIKSVKLRGQPSNGMICSYKEIGVADYMVDDYIEEGIAVLDPEAPIGEDAIAYLGLDDVIFDVSLTPNRADCLAMDALALEVGALLDQIVTLPYNEPVITTDSTPLIVRSETENGPQFLGRIIEKVTLKPSPQWIKAILIANGIKPLNNIVDISNLVMLETGQPCHFYDRDLISDEITVKDKIEMDYVALDENTYQLQKEDVLITSNNEVIGIGGIMGGELSKINDDTSALILEMAQFDRVAIRHSSRRLNLMTDAAQRFSKGIDPLAVFKAMERATALLVEYADAQVIHPVVSILEQVPYQRLVQVKHSHINGLLGTKLKEAVVLDVFERLNFKPELKDGVYTCDIPSYRQDISIGADLIEEVIRLIGFDIIDDQPLHLKETVGRLTRKQHVLRQYKQLCGGFNLHEVITYTLMNPKYKAGPFGLDEPYEIASPLSEDRKMVRNQLFHAMLQNLSYNVSYKNKPNNFFEISEVYGKNTQETRLAIVLNDDVVALDFKNKNIKGDFYALKGMLEVLVDAIGLNRHQLTYQKVDSEQPYLHPHQSGNIYYQDQHIGYGGLVHPTLAKEYDVSDVWILEIDVDGLLGFSPQPVTYETISKLIQVEKDLALVMRKDISLKAIQESIVKAGQPYIEDVHVFDVYESESLGPDHYSIALHLYFKTKQIYTDAEIQAVVDTILAQLAKEFGVTLR